MPLVHLRNIWLRLTTRQVRADQVRDGDRLLVEIAKPNVLTPPLRVLGNPNGTPRPHPSWPVWMQVRGVSTELHFMPDAMLRIRRAR